MLVGKRDEAGNNDQIRTIGHGDGLAGIGHEIAVWNVAAQEYLLGRRNALMRCLGEKHLPFRIEDAHRVHRRRRKLGSMRCDKLVEHGVQALASLEDFPAQEARLWRRRKNRAVCRNAAEHDVLDHRHEELRLPLRNDRAVCVAQGDDALSEVLRELQVADAVEDAPALHLGEVRILHYYEVKRPAQLRHVLGQVQEPRPAAVRRRIAGDYCIVLY